MKNEKKKKQEYIFLKKEGDSWFKRNVFNNSKATLKKNQYKKEIENLIKKKLSFFSNVLEIGCSSGELLNYLKHNFPKLKIYGLEPSRLAIKHNYNRNIIIKHGVASEVPFKDNKFDLLIFGFCLYVCDNSSLIKILSEADRVTKKESYIVIYDFYSNEIEHENYEHDKRIVTRKMDYSKMFLWNPFYKIYSKKLFPYQKKIKKQHKKLSNLAAVIILKKKEI